MRNEWFCLDRVQTTGQATSGDAELVLKPAIAIAKSRYLRAHTRRAYPTWLVVSVGQWSCNLVTKIPTDFALKKERSWINASTMRCDSRNMPIAAKHTTSSTAT